MVNHGHIPIASTLLLLCTLVLSGPFVGAVDLTPSANIEDNRPAIATVSSITLPDTATFAQRSHDSNSYYLDLSNARAKVRSISGQPLLLYEIEIPELGYIRSEAVFLDKTREGTVEIPMHSDTFSQEELERIQYKATLRVLMKDGSGEDVLLTQVITVEVPNEH